MNNINNDNSIEISTASASRIVESAWKPVKLGTGGGRNSKQQDDDAYQVSSYVQSSSWYNKIVQNDGIRIHRLKNYYDADQCSIEISRALDIIAEDISSSNADDEDQFYIHYEDEAKVKKTTLRLMGDALALWEQRTEMDIEFFDRVRKTLVYGATFYKKNKDGTLTELPAERMVGYILSEDDENFVTHYLYDPSLPRLDQAGRTFTTNSKRGQGIFGAKSGINKTDKYETYAIDDLVVLKIGGKPFGESLIEPVYALWKTMKLIEDAVVIYRVTRSHERRVYYIDVGNLQGAKREQAIERQRIRLMQKNSARHNKVVSEANLDSFGEDIFVPVGMNGKGSRIETLQGGATLGELTDLEWFSKKLAAGLRIPYSMIDMADQSQTQYADMRVGQMYAIEMRYISYVKRFKRRFAKELANHFIEWLKDRQLAFPEDATFRINDSNSFAEYKQIELDQSRLNVFNSTLQVGGLSKKVALQKYLGYDLEDLVNNEIQFLAEKGLDDKVIKTMPQNVIDNIVYGDGRLGEEYGIKSADDGGMGF